MLLSLSIRDFVIVDALELSFQAGFTVFTGETGAGKSILIDALNMALGERADPSVVRQGKERAEIAAEFNLNGLNNINAWLAENDLTAADDTCLVRRVVEAAGRSRAYINGHPVTVQQLRELGDKLVAIHGQFAHQALLQPNAQQNLLDDFAGAGAIANAVSQAHSEWNALKKLRIQWQSNALALEQERSLLESQQQELSKLDFRLETWQELLAEHSRLNHAASLIEGVQWAQQALDERDDALMPQINAVVERLKSLSEYDPAIRSVLDIIEPASLQLQESVYALRHYSRRLDIDPMRLKDVEARIETVHNVARKYRVRPIELIDLLGRCDSRLSELGGDAGMAALIQREQVAETHYFELAKALGAQRQKAAKKLVQAVTASMQTLAMTGGKFVIDLPQRAEPSANGLEHVIFSVAGHAGVTPGALDKVASGGELSRIGLALQVVLSKIARVPTLIFDEVDAGIGGAVAEVVGKLLRDLGAENQVMCVTHLPQVAAQGEHHFIVSKATGKGTTVSSVEPLSQAQRIDEIARMLGGVKITDATRKHAAEMLSTKST